MARRNAVRRKLDDGQHEEAVKVLKKFVQTKYRGSLLISQPDLLGVDGNQTEQFQRPQSLLLGSRNFERQSTQFSFPQHVFEATPALSPKVMSLDFEEPTVLEEIKFDARKDTYLTYPIRLFKSLIQIQITKQIICLLLIAFIGLTGGLIFQYFERPNQILEELHDRNITHHRHRNFAKDILLELTNNECFQKMSTFDSMNIQLTKSNSYCHHALTKILQRYDDVFKEDHGISEQWEWDYWNSVFFSGTVFTTIGYGILAPKTFYGRIFFIFYALVSIPLLFGVMNVFGAPILRSFRDNYGIIKRKCSKSYRNARGRYWKYRLSKSPNDTQLLEANMNFEKEEEKEESNLVDEYEKVPWQIAIIILFTFLMACSWLFTLWEDWTFFESFYFTFTSLTTIGFGDVVPRHPRFALILYIFYISGLFVVSTAYAYMQSKVEEKYFWALQLIDQSTGNEIEPRKEPETPTNMNDDDVRWRPESQWGGMSIDGMNTDGFIRNSTILMPNGHDEARIEVPPTIKTLIRTLSTKGTPLARSESVLSKNSFNSKWRPFSNSPSISEQLTPVDNRKMWGPEIGSQTSLQLGPKPATSAPSLAPIRNLTAEFPLSVITEVSDEEAHSRRNTRRNVSELLHRDSTGQESAQGTDTGTDDFEMIDHETIDDTALDNVVEAATDESSENENDTLAEMRPDSFSFSSSRSRGLQRAPAQDLETPSSTDTPPPIISTCPLEEDVEPDEQVTGL